MSHIYSAHLIVGVEGSGAARRLPRPPHTFIKHRPVVTRALTHTQPEALLCGVGGGQQRREKRSVNTETRQVVRCFFSIDQVSVNAAKMCCLNSQ